MQIDINRRRETGIYSRQTERDRLRERERGGETDRNNKSIDRQITAVDEDGE